MKNQPTNFFAFLKSNVFLKYVFAAFVLILIASGSLTSARAQQRRDHLNDLETDIVREAQQIDLRTEVFVKAIDRRFLVLNNQPAPTDKKSKKEADKWGDLPVGTRKELLQDIEGILREAIENIDDVAERDQTSEFFPKAVRTLADGANRFLPELKIELQKSIDEKEKGAILGAMDECSQIIEASAKLPKEAPKESKKSKKDSN